MPCALKETDVSAGETHEPATAEAAPTVGAADESESPPSAAAAVGVVDDAVPEHEQDNHMTAPDGGEEQHLDKEELAQHADTDDADEHPAHDDIKHLLKPAVEEESGLLHLEAEAHVVRLAEHM